MVWVYIALTMVVLLLLLTHFLKFRFSLTWQVMESWTGTFKFSFLGFGKEFVFSPGPRLDSELQSNQELNISPGQKSPSTNKDISALGQGGFIRIPASLHRRIIRIRKRFKKAFLKFALDLKVWTCLLKYMTKTGIRVIGFLNLKLAYLQIGFADVLFLGRFAAIWSSLSSLIPALACPVHYVFNQKKPSARLEVAGSFTALGLMFFTLITLLRFPWLSLARRFWVDWRNPELNRWQRRLLLF